MTADKNKLDPFIAEAIYPDPGAIFTARYKSVEEIKNTCMIVLDTNALLVPYAIGKDSLQQIRYTYEKLIEENRLVIPSQVAREFAKNRAGKLGELFQQFNRKLSGLSKLHKGRYPLLEELETYQIVLKLESEIDTLQVEYKKAIQKVISDIRNWTWNDPVSLLYSDLFRERVIHDLSIDDKDELLAQLNYRQVHNIPPGYKDSGKDDEGIGDYLIWLTILETGKSAIKSVLFVSGDEKADWFHKSEKQALYPRYELIDEFRRKTNGHSFHIVSFSTFLNLYGASDSIVQEIRKEEEKLISTSSLEGIFVMNLKDLEIALYEKCEENNPGKMRAGQATAQQMTNLLLEIEVISADFYNQVKDIYYLHNRLVHKGSDSPSSVEIEKGIYTIHELFKKLSISH